MRAETAALPFSRREPAGLLAGAQAAVVALIGLAAVWRPVSDGTQAVILGLTGAIVAALTGWKVAPRRPALLFGVVQAGLPVAVTLGLEFPAGGDTALLVLAASVIGWLTRSQVSPAAVGPPPPRPR